MATSALPSADNVKTVNAESVPPDERFWQRYSPHAEFPLSSAGSLTVHLLILGVLLLAYFLFDVLSLFGHANRSLPVEAVRLDLGGGGGKENGKGDAPNHGREPVEASGTAKEDATENVPSEDAEKPKTLDVKPGPQLSPQFDAASIRLIQQTDTPSAKAFQRLSDVTSRIRVPDSGRGQGGKGSGGGSGDGTGTGVGNGEGAGRGTLTQREKRMLRWSMLFNTDSGENYVAQLKGLGAILAIPISENADGREYRIVRDLGARPAKLNEEDLSKIQRIYWIDDKPQSVRDVLRVLGVKLPTVPSHFVAFMPEELEKTLRDLEGNYLKKRYPARTEDDIVATKFKIHKRTGGKYEPEVTGLELKK